MLPVAPPAMPSSFPAQPQAAAHVASSPLPRSHRSFSSPAGGVFSIYFRLESVFWPGDPYDSSSTTANVSASSASRGNICDHAHARGLSSAAAAVPLPSWPPHRTQSCRRRSEISSRLLPHPPHLLASHAAKDGLPTPPQQVYAPLHSDVRRSTYIYTYASSFPSPANSSFYSPEWTVQWRA